MVDLPGLGHQFGQMLQAGADGEVPGLVDDGFDAQGSPIFEVLLDPAVLVGEVDLDFGAGREDPAPEWLGGGGADLAGEGHGHLVGPADVDVVSH